MADWREAEDRRIADALMSAPPDRKAVGDRTPHKVAMLLAVLLVVVITYWMQSGSADTPTRTGPDPDAASPGSSVIEDLLDREVSSDVPILSETDAEHARAVVGQFVDHLRAGDVDAAAALWTGDPGDPALRHDGVVAFAAEYPWLVSTPSYRTVVTPGFGWSRAVPVVTVVGEAAAGQLPGVAAFVVDRPLDLGGSDVEPGMMEIRRLPSGGAAAEPPAGSAVAAGQIITVAALPVEGGVTVHFDGIEVAARQIPGAESITFEVPDTALGTAILTISVATPEDPSATALVYEVV